MKNSDTVKLIERLKENRERIQEQAYIELGTIATEPEENYLLASGARAGGSAGQQVFNNQIVTVRSGVGEIVTGSTPAGVIGILLRGTADIRADIRRRDDGLSLVTSSSSAAPGTVNGIHISNSGTLAIGTLATSTFIFDRVGSGTVNERIRSTDGSVVVNLVGPAGNVRDIRFLSSGNRWAIRADNVAEGGADAGSNFRVIRYDDAGSVSGTPFFIRRSNGYVGINNTNPQAQLHIDVSPSGGGEKNALAMFSEGEHVLERDQLDSGANGTVLGLRRRNMADNENRAVLRIAHQSVNNDPPDNSGRLGANIAWQGTGYDGTDVDMGWMGFHWTFDSTALAKEQGFYMGLFEPSAVVLMDGKKRLTSFGSDRIKYKVPDSVVDSSDLSNGEVSWYLDESNDLLVAKTKYSDGTVKTGSIALS